MTSVFYTPLIPERTQPKDAYTLKGAHMRSFQCIYKTIIPQPLVQSAYNPYRGY